MTSYFLILCLMALGVSSVVALSYVFSTIISYVVEFATFVFYCIVILVGCLREKIVKIAKGQKDYDWLFTHHLDDGAYLHRIRGSSHLYIFSNHGILCYVLRSRLWQK